MPELPEVETTARGLRAKALGRRIAGARGMDWARLLPNSSPEEVAETLPGRAIVAVDRRGKYLLLRLEGDVSLAIHRKMSGNLLLRAPGAPADPHTHLVLGLDSGEELRFVDPRKFGRVYLFRSEEELRAFLDERLGPEPLEAPDDGTFFERLRRRRTRIKSLLLDQAFLAGVGNIYADEALWVAGIHPLRPADSLSRHEAERLLAAIRLVLAEAIERRGTSFSQYVDAEGQAGENQGYLRAYGRGAGRAKAAEPCSRCGTAFGRISIAQRSSHFCPTCQPQRLGSGTGD